MTLVEVVVAMIVLALAVVAVMAGMTTLAASSYSARQRADVAAALRSASEVVKSTYFACGGTTNLVTSYGTYLSTNLPSSALPKIGSTTDVNPPSVVAVGDASNPTGIPFTAGCGSDSSDPGLQAVEITDSSTDNKVSETLWVVVGSAS